MAEWTKENEENRLIFFTSYIITDNFVYIIFSHSFGRSHADTAMHANKPTESDCWWMVTYVCMWRKSIYLLLMFGDGHGSAWMWKYDINLTMRTDRLVRKIIWLQSTTSSHRNRTREPSAFLAPCITFTLLDAQAANNGRRGLFALPNK